MTNAMPAAESTTPSLIDEISRQYTVDLANLSPATAIWIGLETDREMDDLSPDGLAERNDLVSSAAEAARRATAADGKDELSREILVERLDLDRDLYASGWAHADLNVIASPLQDVRLVFDLLPHETADDLDRLGRHLRGVPAALAGYRESLRSAAGHGRVVAARQLIKGAEQCATYGGNATEPGFFRGLVAGGPDGHPSLADGAAAADLAYRELGEFLIRELLPLAPERDAVGEERYRLASRDFLGEAVDLAETYAWGWQEFLSIEAELLAVAERVAPGAGPRGAAAVLDADPTYQVHGHDGLQAWMQHLSDRAVAELGRTLFDIAEPLRELRCGIAPPGGGVGAYYSGPNSDFSRPGQMWFSVEPGREDFSIWREISVVYHEGVPGHHLQIATATYQRDKLNDFRRLLAGTSGHSEGWALYAERLMRELGYLDSDAALLGMLDGQLFRAARVIVDIGMHLELTIPAGTGFHERERWTPDYGLEFLLTRTVSDPAHCRDEIDRYLGWPGQAPAYKVGERVWLAGRDGARRRHGAAFDPTAFHAGALALGGMGLGALRRQLDLL